jgi:hypothetical protein
MARKTYKKTAPKRAYKPSKKATATRKPIVKKNANKVFTNKQMSQYVQLVNLKRNPLDQEE